VNIPANYKFKQILNNLVSFTFFPFVSVINRVEVFTILLLFSVTFSQTIFGIREAFSIIKYIILMGLIVFEILLILLISLSYDIKRWKIQPHVWLAIIFITYIFIASFLSIDISTSLSKSVSLLMLFITALFIIPYFVDALKIRLRMINIFYYFACLILVLNIPSIFLGSSFIYSSRYYFRLNGIFENPNMLGLFCFVSLTLIVFKIIVTTKKEKRVLNIFFLILVFILSIMSFSRASLLAISVFILIILYFYKKKLFIFGVSLTAIVVVVVLISPVLLQLLRLASDPFTVRDKLWEIAITTWKSHKLFGTGYGTAGIITNNRFLFQTKGITDYLLGKHFHNIYVELLCETGIFGLGIFVTLLLMIGKEAIKKIKTNKGQNRDLAITYFAFFVAILPQSFFESFFLSAGNISSIMFWILTGIVLQEGTFHLSESRYQYETT